MSSRYDRTISLGRREQRILLTLPQNSQYLLALIGKSYSTRAQFGLGENHVRDFVDVSQMAGDIDISNIEHWAAFLLAAGDVVQSSRIATYEAGSFAHDVQRLQRGIEIKLSHRGYRLALHCIAAHIEPEDERVYTSADAEVDFVSYRAISDDVEDSE